MESNSNHHQHVNTQKAPLGGEASRHNKGSQAYAAMAQKAYQSNMGGAQYSNLGSTFDAYDDQDHARPNYKPTPAAPQHYESPTDQSFDHSFNAQFARGNNDNNIQDAQIYEAEDIIVPQNSYQAVYEQPIYDSSNIKSASLEAETIAQEQNHQEQELKAAQDFVALDEIKSSEAVVAATGQSVDSQEAGAKEHNNLSLQEWSDFMQRLEQYPNENVQEDADEEQKEPSLAAENSQQVPSGQEWSDFMQRLEQHSQAQQRPEQDLNAQSNYADTKYFQSANTNRGYKEPPMSQPPIMVKEKLSDNLAFHILMVAIISLLLLIPSLFFDYVLSDRQYTENDAIDSIIEPWGEAQIVADPVLAIPVVSYRHKTQNIDGKESVYKEYADVNYFAIADDANSSTKLALEKRSRGNYEATLYKATIEQKGSYDLNAVIDSLEGLSATQMNERYSLSLYFPVMYKRAIDDIIALNINGKDFVAEPSSFDSGFMVVIDPEDVFKILQGKPLGESNPLGDKGPALYNSFKGSTPNTDSFNLLRPGQIQYYAKYVVRGAQLFAYMPVGRQCFTFVEGIGTVPSFTGKFLPSEHEIDEAAKSFNATYRQSSLATGTPMLMSEGKFSFSESDSYQLSIADRSMSYTLIERLTKYVLLFISMTFVTVLAFEIVSKRMVSLVQYVVIGVALVLFYMVLLSLNEHINFTLSYIIAALLMSSMIALYLKAVLNSLRSALCMFLLLLAMYAVLFAIVHIQSYALLVGTILLVIMLAVVMFITRRLNERPVLR